MNQTTSEPDPPFFLRRFKCAWSLAQLWLYRNIGSNIADCINLYLALSGGKSEYCGASFPTALSGGRARRVGAHDGKGDPYEKVYCCSLGLNRIGDARHGG
jgi:hypothetical protein